MSNETVEIYQLAESWIDNIFIPWRSHSDAQVEAVKTYLVAERSTTMLTATSPTPIPRKYKLEKHIEQLKPRKLVT
ncbi:unnamed protein product [Umbelopsis vinacea]